MLDIWLQRVIIGGYFRHGAIEWMEAHRGNSALLPWKHFRKIKLPSVHTIVGRLLKYSKNTLRAIYDPLVMLGSYMVSYGDQNFNAYIIWAKR